MYVVNTLPGILMIVENYKTSFCVYYSNNKNAILNTTNDTTVFCIVIYINKSVAVTLKFIVAGIL